MSRSWVQFPPSAVMKAIMRYLHERARGVWTSLSGLIGAILLTAICCAVIIAPLWYAANRYPHIYSQVILTAIIGILCFVVIQKIIARIRRNGIRASLLSFAKWWAILVLMICAFFLYTQRTIWGYGGAIVMAIGALILMSSKRSRRAK